MQPQTDILTFSVRASKKLKPDKI